MSFATLETRRKLGRVKLLRTVARDREEKCPIADRRVPRNDPKNRLRNAFRLQSRSCFLSGEECFAHAQCLHLPVVVVHLIFPTAAARTTDHYADHWS